MGTGNDLQIYHDGSNSYITNATNNLQIVGAGDGSSIALKPKSAETGILIDANGAVELYYDGIKQINTTSTGVTLGDNKRIDFGDGADLKIYHDGSNSYLTNTLATGDLILDSAQNFYIKHSGEVQIQCVNDGAVNLYHDGTLKFSTMSNGVDLHNGNLNNSGHILSLIHI